MPAPRSLAHKGRTVPYIAAWSGETARMPRVLVTRKGISLKGRPKDPSGVAWKPWRNRPGVGEPHFNVVHTPRQRHAMRDMLCQVCARPVERNALGWPWLLEDSHGEPGWPEREVTTHPPVCPRCQPVAAVQCRHLRGSVVSVRVGRVLTDGVYGELHLPARRSVKTVLFDGDMRLRWMVGSQVAATLFEVTVVDMRTQIPAPRGAVRR